MEIYKPNRNAARPHHRPLGGRKLTKDHARAELSARQFTPSSDFNRFEAITILRRVANRLPERGGARWTQALLTHIEFLVGHTSDRDWQDGRPVVWMSRGRTAELLGITAGQVTARENALMRLGALTFNDSANHKRYGRRCPDTGRIIEACGVNLAPLGRMLHYLRQIDGIAAEEARRRSIARQTFTVLRRKIRGIFAGMEEGMWPLPEGAALDELVRSFEALLPARLGRTTPAEEVEGYVDQLQAFLATLEAPVDAEAADQIDDRAVNRPFKAAETLLNDEKIHPTGPIDQTLGTDPSIAHRIQTESLVKDTGSPDGGARRRRSSRTGGVYGRDGNGSCGDEVPVRRTAQQVALADGKACEAAGNAVWQAQGARDGGIDRAGAAGTAAGHRSVSGRAPARDLPPLRSDIRDEIPIGQIVAAMPDDIRRQLNRISRDAVDWGDLMLVADELAPKIGISPSAWEEARRLMGHDTAALAVLIIEAKRHRGLVWQPGGYLRGMTRKWTAGALNLRPALFGLGGESPIQ